MRSSNTLDSTLVRKRLAGTCPISPGLADCSTARPEGTAAEIALPTKKNWGSCRRSSNSSSVNESSSAVLRGDVNACSVSVLERQERPSAYVSVSPRDGYAPLPDANLLSRNFSASLGDGATLDA